MPPSPLDELAGGQPEAALGQLATSREGLTAAEAAARLARDGSNELAQSGRPLIRVLLGQLRSPLLGLLVAAAMVSIAVGEHTSGVIILVIVALSVGLGVFNEYGSEQTLASLRSRTGRRAMVLRDGVATEIQAVALVVGDICLLQVGDVVPADLRLIDVAELTIDEAGLTGEAYPAEKETGSATSGTGAAIHANCAYMGSVVRGGRGVGVVAAIGMKTRLGDVAGGLQERQPATTFQRGLSGFAGFLAKVTALLTVSIFVINAAVGRPILQTLLFALAIAVGLTPQLLPAIVTVSLATGARRMARKQVLVKRLVSIEDLGNADLLFTDKTGTLTEGEIRFREAVGPSGAPAPDLVRLALLASELHFEHGATPLGTTLDLAVWQALEPAVAAAELDRAPAIARLPFTFERRRSSVVTESGGQRRLLCKGAAEEVLSRCTTVRLAGSEPLEPRRADVEAVLGRLLDAGHRLLALAERTIDVRATYTDADEAELELLGFLAFADPPKADAAESVARLRRLGIELKVLTGDNERTAAYVCHEVGLPVAGIARGEDLIGLSDDELAGLVARTTVFARVGPEQKAALVTAAQRNGDDVAFLGDGVNDAVALHRADVGISVESAVDVAREAADVVLLEKSLGALADGVVEGRRIFANTMKYVLMGTSSNFGNMFSAAAASLFLSFLPMLPSQILLNNLLYDCSELTIPTDNVDEELLARPEHWDIGFIRRFMAVFGPISSLYDFATFGVMLWVFHADASLFRSGWFVESLATQALVVFVIRTRRVPFFSSRPSRPLLATTLAVVLVGLLIPYSPAAHLLGFRALPLLFLAILVAMAVTYLALAELAKSYFFRHEASVTGGGPNDQGASVGRSRFGRRRAKRGRPQVAIANPVNKGVRS